MNDEAALRALLADAQFAAAEIDSVRLAIHGAPLRMAEGSILGTPRAALIAQRGVDPRDVVAQAAAALQRVGGDPYRGHAQALVVRAQAG